MRDTIFKRVLSIVLSAMTVFSVCMPSPALALLSDVEVENHTQAEGATTVSGVSIDGVSAPQAGSPLDDTATVSTDQGASWDIPVLWVSDDFQLAGEAEEGKTYLPALAFYVADGYALDADPCTVRLSDSLTKLFGGVEIVSVYNAATGITYILPASIKGLFASQGNAAVHEGEAAVSVAEAGQREADSTPTPTPEVPVAAESAPQRSVVDIYCAQTAKDALTDEELEWLIDLIINYLEPQAVEYLLNSFPAFRAGAANGEIGTQIGLYIYYLNGDKDGLREHESATNDALAYVSPKAKRDGDAVKYCYMVGVNIDDLLIKDDDEKPIRDEETGKFQLLRVGDKMHTLENTLVHELFHAMMDDYNRTGMAGVTDIKDYVLNDKGEFATTAIAKRFEALHFPTWFIEGSATAVENAYQQRKTLFEGLRMGANGALEDKFSSYTLVECYLNGKQDGSYLYYQLLHCDGGKDEAGNDISNNPSAYVCGYLATVYLSDLASIKNTGSSAIIVKGGTVEDVSTDKLRLGLNSILERLHRGETLDQVIADISPVDNKGEKLYKSTGDFQNKFIVGAPTKVLPNGNEEYAAGGDETSVAFVVDYLNYLKYVSDLPNRNNQANGSILLPVDVDTVSPLDMTKATSSDYLKIVKSNEVVESTVPDSVALAGGGKSSPDAGLTTASVGEEPAKEDSDSVQQDDVAQDATSGEATDQQAATEPNETNAADSTTDTDLPLAPAAKMSSQDGEE